MGVEHVLGCRCQGCRFASEPGRRYLVCGPRALRRAGRGLSLPASPVNTALEVNPLAQAPRHFQPPMRGGEVRG